MLSWGKWKDKTPNLQKQICSLRHLQCHSTHNYLHRCKRRWIEETSITTNEGRLSLILDRDLSKTKNSRTTTMMIWWRTMNWWGPYHADMPLKRSRESIRKVILRSPCKVWQSEWQHLSWHHLQKEFRKTWISQRGQLLDSLWLR